MPLKYPENALKSFGTDNAHVKAKRTRMGKMQIDKEVKEQLKVVADKMCITVSKLVNSILRDYIRKLQK